MTGSLLAMPMLILNMGGEMLYVLDQRLHAQSISAEKAAKGALRRRPSPPPRHEPRVHILSA